MPNLSDNQTIVIVLLLLTVAAVAAALVWLRNARVRRSDALDAEAKRLVGEQEQLREEKGRFAEALRAVDDERRQAVLSAERERVDAKRAHDEFLAKVSHELRNPLNAIVGWTHVLAGRTDADLDEKEATDAILRAAKSQTQTIDHLVDTSLVLSDAWLRPAAVIATDAAAAPRRSELEGIRVLVVEDDADTLRMMQRLLRRNGAEVATAGSAQEGLDCVQRFHPDVLVSDIGLVGADGYELIRRVRALRPEQGGRTPALALTSYARPDDELRALGAGFEYHLAKPLVAERLLEKVSSLAERAQR